MELVKSNPQDDEDNFDELRRLLVGPELEKLDRLASRLEGREQFSEEVSQILPLAMKKSAVQGDQLSEAMVPTVEEIVRLSIKRDINKFANALFPVIGPAIRKSIAETFRQMLQTLNQALESSFSWQGIKWRMESIRTGIPFAQIVMLHGLIYRVEQVFLIHRDTSLLLNHVEPEGSQNQNADLVSSMLSAIVDFVGDSFKTENRQALDSIKVGDLSIWIEQGPDVILALAIRGDAPNSLRTTMQQTLEQIQQQFESQLSGFDGDIAPFDSGHELLLDCMQSRYKKRNQKISLTTWLIGIVMLILLFYWLMISFYQRMLQNDYVSQLEKEPGYVVTRLFRQNGQLVIKGLRDPLSRKPGDLLSVSMLDSQQVNHQFEPYQSLKAEFVHKRLIQVLNPPANITLEINNDAIVVRGFATEDWIQTIKTRLPLIAGLRQVDSNHLSSHIDLAPLAAPATVTLLLNINSGHLEVSGRADKAWREQARRSATGIEGILTYQDSRLIDTIDLAIFNAPEMVTLQLQQGVLKVSGSADNDWIQTFKSMVTNQQDIETTDLQQLVNIDEQQLAKDIQSLEQEKIFFDSATSFNFEESSSIDRVIKLVWQIIKNSKKLSQQIEIIVRGHSDSVGLFEDNVMLSLERADYVSQSLFNTGISPKYIQIKGIETPAEKESSIAEQRFNRRVTFEVKVN